MGVTSRLRTPPVCKWDPPVCKWDPVPFTYGTLTCFTQGEISLSRHIYEYGTRRTEPICKRRSHMHTEYAVCPTVPPEHCAPSSSTTVAFVVSNIIVAVAATLSVVAVVYYKMTEKKKSSSSSSSSDDTVTITLPPGPRPRPLLKYTKRTHR